MSYLKIKLMSGYTLLNISRSSGFTFRYLAECINKVLGNNKSPD